MADSTRHIPPFQLSLLPGISEVAPTLQEPHGVVYTKPWIVELILDLAGYTPEQDLAATMAVEPAAGDGAFLVPMVRRLTASCCRFERPILDATQSLLAYELDARSAEKSRQAVVETLITLGVPANEAAAVSAGWVRVGDYLVDAPALPQADFVIGNPPYIRLEDLDDGLAAGYRALYRTMVGRADIYVAFFEAALRQLKPQGVCVYICADRWMLNQYGRALRELVTAGFAVEKIIELHNADAFLDDVSAYPAITVIRRDTQGPVVVARATREVEAFGPQLAEQLHRLRTDNCDVSLPGVRAARVDHWFSAGDPWPCFDPARLALLAYLENNFEPLESQRTQTTVGIGVATGADAVFITTDPHLVEDDRLLPLAMASDATSGTFAWSGHYLVDPWSPTGLVDLKNYPRLRAYLEAHKEQLAGRHVGKKQPTRWYRTIDRVNHALTTKPKLYIADIKDRIEPVLDRGQTYPHHNLYFVQPDRWDPEVLGGLLLSAIGQFFVECYGVRMRGGYLRFQAQYLRRIRVPRPEAITPEQQAALRDAFRQRDRDAATQVALAIYGIDSLPNEDAG